MRIKLTEPTQPVDTGRLALNRRHEQGLSSLSTNRRAGRSVDRAELPSVAELSQWLRHCFLAWGQQMARFKKPALPIRTKMVEKLAEPEFFPMQAEPYQEPLLEPTPAEAPSTTDGEREKGTDSVLEWRVAVPDQLDQKKECATPAPALLPMADAGAQPVLPSRRSSPPPLPDRATSHPRTNVEQRPEPLRLKPLFLLPENRSQPSPPADTAVAPSSLAPTP
ncbi:MAG: hypothetical protein H7836_15130, partial [Magnetococcus sp. YQC-3]